VTEPMEHVRLGRTGLFVSRLCLGAGTFGLHADEAESRQILDEAADAGITFIDTADAYPLGGSVETAGRSEEIIGTWLGRRRQDFIIATKVQARMGPHPWDTGTSRKHILDAIDASLRRLRTDYVDLYQIHNPDPNTPIDETLEALDIVVRSGKARYIGCSNFLAYQVARALGRSEALRLAKFVSVQPRYNLLFRQIERELLPLCREEGLAVLPYNPLAGGLLTGKHSLERTPTSGRFSVPMYRNRYWHEKEFRTVERVREVARGAGVSHITLALSWILANPAVTSVIIGASKPGQLAPSVAALNSPADAQIKAQLDELTHDYRIGDPPIR
jgi:1-deoxyxylulose-5-phosphate synthase